MSLVDITFIPFALIQALKHITFAPDELAELAVIVFIKPVKMIIVAVDKAIIADELFRLVEGRVGIDFTVNEWAFHSCYP